MHALIKPNTKVHFTKWMTSIFLSMGTFFISSAIYGQAGDLSQIRNGDGKVKNQVLDACGDCWVNGNAGASNAHYREGYSIAYRSLITGLVAGRCYEYELGYDTYHSAMAIDYLTHFQRLEPHGPFGHAAEVINPLSFVSGSTKYNMTVVAGGTNTFPIKAPQASGIASGAVNSNGSPRDISQQPVTSFNSLPAAERMLTIYNGEIQDFNYVSQAPIVIGGADAETRIRIRFQAMSDSVVLAWGGHIASRLDWGYTLKQGKIVPLSAAGISGSPYHMRQKAFDRVECNENPQFPSTLITAYSGFGNQDRSLSAAAVFPPPECPTVTSQTQCYENLTFNFDIDAPQAGVIYTWSFGTNTVGAVFQGGTNTGNSVTVVANPGADVQGVDNGGSFTLNITASLNGVPQECPGVATGTVVDVDVAASANPTAINLATGSTSALSVTSISPGAAADYNFVWSVVTIPPNGDASITGAAADGSATFNVLTPYQTGTYVARVVATQKAAPFCKDSADVTIEVSGGTPPCKVTGEELVCPGATHTYIYDPDEDEIANAIPDNFTAQWTFSSNSSGATFDGSTTGNSVDVIAGAECDKSYTVRITLTSTSGLLSTYCEKTVSVNDTEAPVITCPADVTLECGDSSDPDDTGEATATDNCSATVTYEDATSSNCNLTVITRTWTATDPCGNTSTCVQLIIIKDTEAPVITCLEDGNITVTDNCSATTNIVTYFKDENGTRKWTAVDESGNTSMKDCPLPVITQVNNTNKPVTEATQGIDIKVADRQINNVDVQKTDLQSRVTPNQVIDDVSELQVKAYPNPFNNTVNFNFISPVSGKVSLEAYDMLGRRVAIIYQGMVDAGSPKTVTYNVSDYNKVPLLYKMSVGELTTHGKLLPMKRE